MQRMGKVGAISARQRQQRVKGLPVGKAVSVLYSSLFSTPRSYKAPRFFKNAELIGKMW
jgi:hypothetical protein